MHLLHEDASGAVAVVQVMVCCNERKCGGYFSIMDDAIISGLQLSLVADWRLHYY